MKVYLCVSYNTSISKIKKLKSKLESYGIEVLQHIKGKEYSRKKLAISNAIISLPPDNTPDSKIVSVGKGQYEEADFALETGTPFYMVRDIESFRLKKLYSVFNSGGENWKKDYGSLVFKDENFSLFDIDIKFKNKKLLL